MNWEKEGRKQGIQSYFVKKARDDSHGGDGISASNIVNPVVESCMPSHENPEVLQSSISERESIQALSNHMLKKIYAYQKEGRMESKLKQHCISTSLSLFRKAGEHWHNYPSEKYISSLEFNHEGTLLASTCNGGYLSVINHGLSQCKEFGGEPASEVFKARVNQRLEAVHWNVALPNELGCVSDTSSQIILFDLEKASKEIVEESRHGNSNFGHEAGNRSGFNDFTFFSSSPHRLAACGTDGGVHIWDRRQSRKQPSASIRVPRVFGALQCLQLIGHSQEVVVAGTDSGCIQAWDLRGGRQSTSAFSGAKEVVYHPLLTLSASQLFSAVPTLKEQAGVQSSAVQSLLQDPSNSKNMAIHLNNGWTGVIDLQRLELTYGHCPPPPWSLVQDDSSRSQPWTRIRRRRPAWMCQQSIYCVPSSACGILHMLDFGRLHSSQYSLHSSLKQVYPESRLELISSIVCTASHEIDQSITVGDMMGKLHTFR